MMITNHWRFISVPAACVLAAVMSSGCYKAGPLPKDAPTNPPDSVDVDAGDVPSSEPAKAPETPKESPADAPKESSSITPEIGAMELALAAPDAPAGGAWGDLTGHFIYDGTPFPTATPLQITKDQAVCEAPGKPKLVDEALTVDAKGNIANVLVFVRTKNPPVHPDYEKTAKDEVILDNKDCRFEPHVVVLRTTQTLLLKNDDPIGHNSKGDPLNPMNPAFNPILNPGAAEKIHLGTEETIPFKVGCSIHPWMSSYVLLRSDPYGAATGADGKFTIKNLPAGKELEFQLWQEKKGYLKQVPIKGVTVDAKGRFKMTLKPGANDLGDIKVPAATFQ